MPRDETAHLLRSPRNAKRLLDSIRQMNDGLEPDRPRYPAIRKLEGEEARAVIESLRRQIAKLNYRGRHFRKGFLMRIFFDILGGVGLLGIALGAACWFAPEDNTENVAMAHFIALPFFGLGGLLFIIALIARAL